MTFMDKGPSLSRVVMPMVDVMRDASLSWAERETIADAILAVRAHWKSMKDEQQLMDSALCAGQMIQPVREQGGLASHGGILGAARSAGG